MISIIICSKYPAIAEQLQRNIRASIGADYEIIALDNSYRAYNIFQAYNIGGDRAKGDVLCFMHDDVMFHSQGWGRKVEEYLADQSVGIIGLAGSRLIPSEGDWHFVSQTQSNLLQHFFVACCNVDSYMGNNVSWDVNAPLSDCCVVDGAWLCMRKDTFDKVRFDEHTYGGFHCYDTDICMQVNKLGLRICLCHDVILEHFSEGLFSSDYNQEMNKFRKKWNADLPYTKDPSITPEIIVGEERRSVEIAGKKIANDIVKLSIISKCKLSSEPSFTDEERRAVVEMAEQYARKSIVHAHSIADAWKATMAYCRLVPMPKAFKMIKKTFIHATLFFWQRKPAPRTFKY